MAKRASIFDSTDDQLDLSSFRPMPVADKNAPSAAEVRAVAQTAKYRSREAAAAETLAPKDEKPWKRSPRQHRTGRNVQFNVKAKAETVQAIYEITDAHPGWVLGYTLERAVAALKRELESQS